jgi:hypothetical protein
VGPEAETKMFKINANQIQQIECDALEEFLVEMEAWAAETFGPQVAMLPPGTVRSEVLHARELGFVLRGHAKRWLALGFELGMPFARTGKAAQVASDFEMTPAARLDILECECIFLLLTREEQEEELLYAV